MVESGTINKEFRVLVINSCQQMAKEINLALMQTLVGVSITYAPTFTVANMLIKKRSFNLIVSAARMPDGRVQKLENSLKEIQDPPNVIVLGNIGNSSSEMLGISGYLFSNLRKLELASLPSKKQDLNNDPINTLGADLRNDLNNPLQEIVAMVYVAKSQSSSNDVTNKALEAINNAAANLSSVVKEIENKIRTAVSA